MYARTEKNGTNQVPTQYAECEKQQQTTTTTLFNTTVYSTKLCTQNRFCTADAVLQYTVVQRTSTSSDNGVPQCLNKIHIYIHRYTQYRHSLHTYIPPREDQCEWHRMTRMTGPDCVVMCNLINTYIHVEVTITTNIFLSTKQQ